MSTATTFNFTVDSALLRELGEKLVSTVHVALSELVKNAYDADATEVRVKIEPMPNGGPKIVIEDNGSGMTPDEVANFWMRIGTNNKESDPHSRRFGRPRTGRKGVGRFACRRLGRQLELQTIASTTGAGGEQQKTITSVTFKWGDFTPGRLVESIPCEGTIQIVDDVQATGTRLVISDADVDEWQIRGYDYVRRQLAVMAGNSGTWREHFEEDPGFDIALDAPGVASDSINLRERVIDASWGTLEAEVRADGCAQFTLHAFGLGGKRTYVTGPRFGDIYGAKLRVGILPDSKGDGVREPALLANYVIHKLIDDWGGVQVRYSGFRMYPYGNPGDDWLEIDADRGRRQGRPGDEEAFQFSKTVLGIEPARVLLNMLGMRNYLGHVDVSADIAGLEPRLDRQGFVETPVFESLRRFARLAIEWATIHRESYIRQREISSTRDAIASLPPALQLDTQKFEAEVGPRAAQFLRQQIGRLVTTLPEEERAQTKQSLLRTVKALEAISEESLSQLRHLRLVASASTLTLLFAHEVRGAMSSLGAGSARLRALAGKIPGHEAELSALSLQLGATQSQLSQLVDMTGIVGAFRSDQRADDVNLKSAVDKAVGCFRLLIDNYDINVDSANVNIATLVGPFVEGEIYSVLINLLSNSIKSLIADGGSRKSIRIWAEELGEKVFLRIADNGMGLDPVHFSDVFTPFISDPNGLLYDRLEEHANPEDATIFGTGSGLGLSIARDILRARGGDIQFINPDAGWSACVEVELP